ncbi:MAG TPA: hypothetical protein VJ976_08735 [Ornithinimicrobium sp.]|uniref:hypothetical protein n=1 Tax=Ornithinimicrobium sp. TaxID=1977084 RepID=UPI002B46309E|nr:hypothetical protein [Ornithinimicrobium sp.]HKJ12455.1 hypothetical protein [Ornithinimicrobium sp.]
MTDPTAVPSFPPPAPTPPLRGRVLDALQELEFGPDLDGEGDVGFTAAEHKMFVRCLDSEKFDIMRVFGQWAISDRVPSDLQTRLNACNDVTLGMNLVKAGIAGGNLVLTVEQVIAKRENPKAKVTIAVGLLVQAVALWHKNVIAKSGTQPPAESEEEGQPRPEPQPWLSEAAVRSGGSAPQEQVERAAADEQDEAASAEAEPETQDRG